MRTERPSGRHRSIWLVAAVCMLGSPGSPLRAQEEGHGTDDEHHHDNSVALFLGAATHVGSGDRESETGFAIGLEYARRVADWLKVGLLAEYASTESERDLVFVLPLFAHLTKSLMLVAGPGIETASSDGGGTSSEEEDHGGKHTDFLLRFGVIYEIELDSFAIGPQINADLVDGHWTLVYGVSFGIGF